MQRHESKTRAKSRVETHWHLDRSTPRARLHPFSVGDSQTCAIRGREQESLALAKWRCVSAGLDAGVERVEAAPRREPDRKLVTQLVDRRIVLNHAKRRERTLHRILPKSRVQELRAGMIERRAGPLDAAKLVDPRVGHAGVHRRKAPALVPYLLGGRLPPVAPEAPRDLADDLDVVTRPRRRLERASHALHATFAAGYRSLRLGPSGRRGQNDVCKLGGLCQEDVLHDQVLEAAEQADGSRLVGLGTR